MAKEYIDREAFYEFLQEQAEPITGAYSRGRNNGLNVAKSALHNREITPAADVAPVVHGRWERDGIMSGEYVCSVCGGSSWYYDTDGHITKSKYCPNCGAKMDGGADDG